MKATQLSLAIFLVAAVSFMSKAQDKPKLEYTVGTGVSIDRTHSLWGVNLTNELNMQLKQRFSLNLGLTYYQSLGSLYGKSLPESSAGKNEEQSSGIFFTPSLKYDLIQNPSGFNLSLGLGPSLQLGGATFISTPFSRVNVDSYTVDKYQRVGVMAELEAEWKSKNPNLRNAVSLSAYGYDKTFAWYLNLTYKVRFQLGKN